MTTKQQTPIKAHFQSLLLVSTGPVGGDPVTVTVLFSFKPIDADIAELGTVFDAEIFLLTGEETTARLLVDEVSGDRVGLLFRVVLSDPVIDKLDKLGKIKAERLENTVAF